MEEVVSHVGQTKQDMQDILDILSNVSCCQPYCYSKYISVLRI